MTRPVSVKGAISPHKWRRKHLMKLPCSQSSEREREIETIEVESSTDLVPPTCSYSSSTYATLDRSRVLCTLALLDFFAPRRRPHSPVVRLTRSSSLLIKTQPNGTRLPFAGRLYTSSTSTRSGILIGTVGRAPGRLDQSSIGPVVGSSFTTGKPTAPWEHLWSTRSGEGIPCVLLCCV